MILNFFFEYMNSETGEKKDENQFKELIDELAKEMINSKTQDDFWDFVDDSHTSKEVMELVGEYGYDTALATLHAEYIDYIHDLAELKLYDNGWVVSNITRKQ